MKEARSNRPRAGNKRRFRMEKSISRWWLAEEGPLAGLDLRACCVVHVWCFMIFV